MFYSLLGRTVWFGVKVYVGRKFGRARVPKSLFASAAVGVGIAVGVAVLRARSDES